MSVIIIQVGQCGNQVGSSIYESIYNDINNDNLKSYAYNGMSENKYFYQPNKSDKLEARSIQIDMEEKVIKKEMSNKYNWKYSNKSFYCQKYGSGNNWASGYFKENDKLIESFDDLLRIQLEQADAVESILITMSVAGGTGSGVGSRLCRHLKETIPEKNLISHCVWPYQQGEVSVQSYNAILSVASLLGQDDNGMIDSNLSVNGLIIHENDELYSACLNRLGITNIGVKALNDLISYQFVSILQPVLESKYPLSDIILENVPNADYRILKLRSTPYLSDRCKQFSTDTWPQLLRHINQMMLTESVVEDGLDWNKTAFSRSSYIRQHLIIRGTDAESADFRQFQKYRKDLQPALIWHQPRSLLDYEKSVCAITNGRDSIHGLRSTLPKAWNMFGQRAFLYQYEKFGLDYTYFLDSFANLEQIIYNYENIY